MADLHVDPEAVERCGNELTGSGDSIRAEANSFASTGALVARDGGLASAWALGACRDAWRTRIADDAAMTSGSATAFHCAVREYRAADVHNAAGIRDPGAMRGY